MCKKVFPVVFLLLICLFSIKIFASNKAYDSEIKQEERGVI